MGDNSRENVFGNNTIQRNQECGIRLEMSPDGNRISRNHIEGNNNGIQALLGSGNNHIEGNVVLDNREFGILLADTTGNVLRAYRMEGNTYNFFVDGLSRDKYLHDIDTSNTVEGKTIVYLIGERDVKIGPSENPGTVYAIECENVLVKDVCLEKNGVGAYFLESSRIHADNVTCRKNGAGITIGEGCDSIDISRTSCVDNDGFGIIVSNGNNVTVKDSEASFNTIRGMLFLDCSRVTVTNTSASQNEGPGVLQGTGIDIEGGQYISLVTTRTSQNRHHGIWFNGAEGIVIKNGVSEENEELGIVGINSRDVSVWGMRISGNGEAGMGLLDIQDCLIADNFFNNNRNIDIADPGAMNTTWNTPKTRGTNIAGGPFLGGNYWATPDGAGWSQITPDRGDGFCNAPFVIDDNNTDYLPLHIRNEPPFYADFTATPLSGYVPLTVQFTDVSDGEPSRYLYRFGDGFMSMSRSPVHTYLKPGNYTVTLTIWKPEGKKLVNTTTYRTGYITVEKKTEPEVEIDFTATPRSGKAPLTVSFTGSSSVTPILWKYSYGDGFMTTRQNPVYTYRRPGTYNVTLTVWTMGLDKKPVSHKVEKTGFITVT